MQSGLTAAVSHLLSDIFYGFHFMFGHNVQKAPVAL